MFIDGKNNFLHSTNDAYPIILIESSMFKQNERDPCLFWCSAISCTRLSLKLSSFSAWLCSLPDSDDSDRFFARDCDPRLRSRLQERMSSSPRARHRRTSAAPSRNKRRRIFRQKWVSSTKEIPTLKRSQTALQQFKVAFNMDNSTKATCNKLILTNTQIVLI